MYGQNIYSQYPYTAYNYPNFAQRQVPQQMVGQPIMQQTAQPTMQYEVPIQDVRFVTSEEAKAFIVMPNSKALLIDKNGGFAHLKTADGMGQSVTQYFKFEQVNPDGSPFGTQEKELPVDFGNFATKKDIEGLPTAEQYKKLEERYNSLFEQLKGIQKMVAKGDANANGTNGTSGTKGK